MKNLCKYLLIIVTAFLPVILKAGLSQPADTLKRKYFFDHEFISETRHIVDTSFTRFHVYNPLFREEIPLYRFLGNTGTAAAPFLFEPDFKSGFIYQHHAYENYLFNVDNIKYYQLRKPFTDISYVMGTRKEQVLRAVHSQNITKTWNAAINFRIIDSPGNYYHQETYLTNFSFCTNFTTKNKKYGVLANFIHNKFIVSENGGIANDSLFETNKESRRIAVPVYLEYAENHIREWGAYLKQYYHFKFRDKDSAAKRPALNLGSLEQSFCFVKSSLAYMDKTPNPLYYPNLYNGIQATYDSVGIYHITNSIFWKSPDWGGTNYHFGLRGGTFLNYHELFQGTGKDKYPELLPSISFNVVLFKNLSLMAVFDYVAQGYNKNDFSVYGKINFHGKDKKRHEWQVSFDLNYNLSSPELIDKYLFTGYLRWWNDFDKKKMLGLKLQFEYLGLKAFVTYNDIYNYIYLDKSCMPIQYGMPLRTISIYAGKTINFWKFGWDNKVLFQHVFNADIVRLPDLVLNSSFYFKSDLFKKALSACIGIEIFYNTPYYSDAYMPVIRDFYLQNTKKTGNFIYGDVFLDLKVKRARLFLKVQNVAEGLMGYNYYLVPHYPLQDRSFKFGVSWMFND